jgi:hypothetical protein
VHRRITDQSQAAKGEQTLPWTARTGLLKNILLARALGRTVESSPQYIISLFLAHMRVWFSNKKCSTSPSQATYPNSAKERLQLAFCYQERIFSGEGG